MIEIEGKIYMHFVSIFIDPGACHSYISPVMVEKCSLQKSKHTKPWLVQLDIGTKRNFFEIIKDCLLNLNGLETTTYLNILPSSSYEVLIGMDWLEKYHAILNYLEKAFTYIVISETPIW